MMSIFFASEVGWTAVVPEVEPASASTSLRLLPAGRSSSWIATFSSLSPSIEDWDWAVVAFER